MHNTCTVHAQASIKPTNMKNAWLSTTAKHKNVRKNKNIRSSYKCHYWGIEKKKKQ